MPNEHAADGSEHYDGSRALNVLMKHPERRYEPSAPTDDPSCPMTCPTAPELVETVDLSAEEIETYTALVDIKRALVQAEIAAASLLRSRVH